MEIYLLRHGIAEKRSLSGKPDKDRALTAKGIKKLRMIGSWMKMQGLKLDLLLSSPLRRACQTVEVLREYYPRVPVRISPAFLPEENPQKAASFLRSLEKNKDRVLAAGHEPHLGKLAAYLLTGQASSEIEFKKAALCKMTYRGRANETARLHWLVTPGMIEPIVS